MKLEAVPCVNRCDPSRLRPLHQFGELRVCRCLGCGLVFLDPRLAESELGQLYGTETYYRGDHATGYDSYERDRELYERTFDRRLALIRRFCQGGRLLDVGCGLGFFLAVAERQGFEAWGIDVSQYAVDQTRDRFAGRVRLGFLEPGVYPDRSFDVITLFDLFEHVYHPEPFVATLDRVIRDDGIVVVATPNQDSLLARVSGRNWVSYKLPEHVYYYTPDTLRRLVAPWFEVIHLSSTGQYCTLAFLADRLRSLSPILARPFAATVRALGLERTPVYVNSGSMIAVLRRSTGETARKHAASRLVPGRDQG